MARSHSQASASQNASRQNRNALEIEKPLSSAPSRVRTPGPTSMRRIIADAAYTTATKTSDILTSAATGVIDEITGQGSARRRSQQMSEMSAPAMQSNEGGVQIPTYAEFAQQEEQKRIQFFQEQQRMAAEFATKRMNEDRKKIEEIHEMLRKEIDKYEKAQKKMDDNLERIKKMLILEQQQTKAGIYHITHAEVLVLMFRAFLANINESNTWLEALITKKSKRGSLFATRSKKSGTQYSMSQEISLARSVG